LAVPAWARTPADCVQLPPTNFHAGLTVALPNLSENRTPAAGVVALAMLEWAESPAVLVARTRTAGARRSSRCSSTGRKTRRRPPRCGGVPPGRKRKDENAGMAPFSLLAHRQHLAFFWGCLMLTMRRRPAFTAGLMG